MSRRLRHRYIAVKIDCGEEIDRSDLADAFFSSLMRLFGEYGASLAELTLIDYDPKTSHAVFRCVHKALEMAKASIVAVKEIRGKRAATQILYVSGTVRALRKRLAV